MEFVGETEFKPIHPKKGFLAPAVRFPWGYDHDLIGKPVSIYKIDGGFALIVNSEEYKPDEMVKGLRNNDESKFCEFKLKQISEDSFKVVKVKNNDTPDQIPDNKLESFTIRDLDALFYSLPDRPAPTPPHHTEGRESALLSRSVGQVRMRKKVHEACREDGGSWPSGPNEHRVRGAKVRSPINSNEHYAGRGVRSGALQPLAPEHRDKPGASSYPQDSPENSELM